jgi:hypothetical protein
MDPTQRAVANPPGKIFSQGAARRKVLWNRPLLAESAQDLHHAVHDGPHVVRRLPPPRLAGGINRATLRPFVIGQVARISQVIAAILRPVLVRPQWNPLPNHDGSHRIQVTQRNQEVLGRTLRRGHAFSPCFDERRFGSGDFQITPREQDVGARLVARHRGFDRLIFGHFRMGKSSGATSSSMLCRKQTSCPG